MADIDPLSRELGEIRGLLEGVSRDIGELKGSVGGIDSRLRRVEAKSAVNGAVAGGVLGVATALVTATLKSVTGP